MAYIQGHARDQMLLLTALTGHGVDGRLTCSAMRAPPTRPAPGRRVGVFWLQPSERVHRAEPEGCNDRQIFAKALSP